MLTKVSSGCMIEGRVKIMTTAMGAAIVCTCEGMCLALVINIFNDGDGFEEGVDG
jgi:hypothetical protein